MMEAELNALENQNNTPEKWEKLNKLADIGLLSAGIAHEVQNPLNFVINFSKLSAQLVNDMNQILEEVKDRLPDDDRDDLEDIAANLNDNMEKIQFHGQRALSIVQSVLLLTRGKNGEKLPTQLNQLVHEYVWMAFHAMRANDKQFNVTIKESYQENLPTLMLVSQDICRAILNLVNNACYAVRERARTCNDSSYVPTLWVETSQPNAQQVVIRIKDNGTGILPEVKEKLFKEVITTKPIGQGTGLGMSITHRIICDEHQGELHVESTWGEGTEFTVVLPVK